MGLIVLDHLRSATKSIMATLIGIGIDKGFINSIEDPISRYIPDTPEDKKQIKIKHLLGMTSGFKWNEGSGYNDHNKMVDSGNPAKHMLALPMVNVPGTHWEYSSGDIHMLSVVLSNASKMSTKAFSQKYLFGPLKIKDFKWQTFGDGYTAGGSRLELKPRDMLKIGQMSAHGGLYKGKRIVSQEYIQRSTDVQYQHRLNDGVSEGYGYGWWTVNVKGSKIFMASGYAGQTIVVAPESNLVVVTTHNWKVNGNQAFAQQEKSQDIAEMVWKWVNDK